MVVEANVGARDMHGSVAQAACKKDGPSLVLQQQLPVLCQPPLDCLTDQRYACSSHSQTVLHQAANLHVDTRCKHRKIVTTDDFHEDLQQHCDFRCTEHGSPHQG